MALTKKDRERWAHIEEIIAENKVELKAATSHEPLKAFAEANGLMNRSDFPKFKHSLRKIGVNYDALRDEAMQAYNDELDARAADIDDQAREAPSVTLWTAAVEGDDGSGAFAVVDEEDTAIWYGRFFDDDRTRVAGDPVSAEQSAAEKAVWLAGKALAEAGYPLGRVRIHTTCHELDVDALRAAGVRSSVAVSVVVDPDDLRAVAMAEAPGFQRWQDADLLGLVDDGAGEDGAE